MSDIVVENLTSEFSGLDITTCENLLEAAASCDITGVEEIFQKYRDKKNFAQVINYRDEEGTNPVGKAFLAHPSDPNAIEIATLFAQEKDYKINSYLNNKNHMDFKTKHLTGGTTLLHNVIICAEKLKPTKENKSSLNSFFEALVERASTDLKPLFPAMCPALDQANKACHMISTLKLFNFLTFRSDILEILCLEKCARLIGIYLKKEEDDESGDSGEEESSTLPKHAAHYRKMLLKIKGAQNQNANAATVQNTSSAANQNTSSTTEGSTLRKSDLAEEVWEYLNRALKNDDQQNYKSIINTMYVPLFHGVPLMKSQYTNQERREIGKQVKEINEKLLQKYQKQPEEELTPEQELTSEQKIMTSIHSRTSTASAGLQSLHEVFTTEKSELEKLEKKSETLKNHFKKPLNQWTEKQKKAIGNYVGQFAKTSSSAFWPAFPIHQEISENPENLEYPGGIVKYRFPVIATSKAVDHPLRFAIGRNVEGSKGETPMEPEYDHLTGKPKHRLAGLLYITLHKLSDIVKGRIDGSVIDFNYDIGKGKSTYRMRSQLECEFFGKIDADKVVCILPIVYPSIRSENETPTFKLDYHHDIFGLSSVSEPVDGLLNPSKIKADLEDSPNPGLKPHLNGFGRMFVPAFGILANGLLSKISTIEENNSKKILVTINDKGELISYNTEWERKKEFSEAQKKLVAPDDEAGDESVLDDEAGNESNLGNATLDESNLDEAAGDESNLSNPTLDESNLGDESAAPADNERVWWKIARNL